MTGPSRLNVLLLVMDTARVDHVLERSDVTPRLTEIAEEGTTFTNAFSSGPWTMPSHASMFTGQYTSEHQAHAGTKRFDPEVPTLAERLRANGYRTVGFSNNTWVSPDFGFDTGFDDFHVGWRLTADGADLAAISKDHDATIDRARAAISKLASLDAPMTLLNAIYGEFLWRRYDDGARMTNWRIDRWLRSWDETRPFFMFVNYLEPHLEYDPPDSFRDRFVPDGMSTSFVESANQDAWSYIAGLKEMDEREFEVLEALYAAELNYLDYRIGRVYDLLEEREILDDTLVIIVGDHGENLGDHGLMDHQYCLYDTLVHVPLIVRYPDAFEAGRETDSLVELRDLYPTILDLAEIEQSDAALVSDRSLLDVDGRSHVVGEYLTPQPSMSALEDRIGELTPEVRQYDRALRSVRTREWTYIEGTDGSRRLYNRIEDPDETTDLADRHPSVCEDLAAVLCDRLGDIERGDDAEGTEMNRSARRRLEDLGYLQ